MCIDKKTHNKTRKYGPFREKKTSKTNTTLTVAIISGEDMVSWHIRIECCIFLEMEHSEN